nr:hypothetical protein GCM10020093_097760 [Planobispora longispora]
MPDDLPLEEPERRLATGPDGPPAPRGRAPRSAVPLLRPGRPADPAGPNVWESSLFGWELLLAASTLLPAVFITLEDWSGWAEPLAAGLMAAIFPVYLLIGRSAIMNDDRRRGIVYIVLIAVLFTPAALLAPSGTFALFGLCPQCFMVLRARPPSGWSSCSTSARPCVSCCPPTAGRGRSTS